MKKQKQTALHISISPWELVQYNLVECGTVHNEFRFISNLFIISGLTSPSYDKMEMDRPVTPGLGIPMEMTPGQIMEVVTINPQILK